MTQLPNDSRSYALGATLWGRANFLWMILNPNIPSLTLKLYNVGGLGCFQIWIFYIH
jgi:hypothetical protein